MTYLAVLKSCVVVPETLFLRLLGKGSVQRQAILELLELPEQPLKANILEHLIKLEVMLKSRQPRSQDDQDLFANLEPVYQEWRSRTLQEGRQEGRQEGHQAGRQEEGRLMVEGMLIAKFGELGTLEAIVPKLLELNAIDRAKAVMELSQEELLKRFG